MKPKIAIFHELLPGGARRGALEFAKNLREKYEVDLYYIDEKENLSERQHADKTFFYQFLSKMWSGGNWKIKLYKDTLELRKLYLLHKKIAKKINKERYVFVFIHGSQFTQSPFLLSFVKRKKIYYCQEPLRITMERYFFIESSLHPLKKIYEALVRAIRKFIDKTNISHADLVLTNSNFTKKNLYKIYKIKGITCFMGVYTNIFYPENMAKKYDLLFIGSYDFIDGYPLLKQALTKIKANLKIKYVTHEDGWIANDSTMRNLYNQSKITLALGYREPFGLIPLESMACATPVLALNEGGYKDSVVHLKTGILVERNPSALAKAITELLEENTKRNIMGENAREYILSNWIWKKKIEEFEKIVKKNL